MKNENPTMSMQDGKNFCSQHSNRSIYQNLRAMLNSSGLDLSSGKNQTLLAQLGQIQISFIVAILYPKKTS